MPSKPISHQKLVEGYWDGRIRIYVNMSRAMHVCDRDTRLPKRVKFTHHLWENTGCLLPLVGVVLFFFVEWYWTAGAVLLGVITIQAARKTSAQSVRDLALENEAFYHDMIKMHVITTTSEES